MESDHFLEMPYRDRQFIAFVDDSDYEVSKKVIESEKTKKSDIALSALKKSAIAIAIPGVMLSGVLGAAIAYGAKELFEKYSNAIDQGIPVKIVPFSLSQNLNLPIGHPRSNVLYVGHPAISNTYIPSSDFHKTIFESRTCELFTILMHLGAKEIQVTHEQTHNRTIKPKANLKAPKQGISEFDFDSEIEDNKSCSITYNGNFEGGEAKALPDNLHWYHQEIMWQKMVEGRLHFGAKNYSLKLNYNEDYGVNFNLKTTLQGIGIELGGKFTEVENTDWIVSGVF